MRLVRNLDDQLVQIELPLHGLQQFGIRLMQAEPDDGSLAADECAAFLDGDVLDPATVVVDGAGRREAAALQGSRRERNPAMGR
jgi:hypothetical protein